MGIIASLLLPTPSLISRIPILMSAASSSEIVLASQGAQCTISTHGAQVLSFVPAPAAGRTEGGGDAGAGGGDVFFMSALEYTDKRKAKRGGEHVHDKISSSRLTSSSDRHHLRLRSSDFGVHEDILCVHSSMVKSPI